MALNRVNTTDPNKATYIRVENINHHRNSHFQIEIKSFTQILNFVADPAQPDLSEFTPIEGGQNYHIPILDPSFADFALDNLDEIGMNPFKAAYEWLKANVDLYRDFTDC